MDDEHDEQEWRDYVWFQTPWHWDWYQWAFVLASGFSLNVIGLWLWAARWFDQ